ncbi:MAG: hypothetical protein EOP05_02230 [Proteobacteria bacterium]|nr:MAG: hypothetical protein EOP05_02230 [Pseudomonadota bacterium]
MKPRIPLRALNENSGFIGLGMWDICAIGYIFVLSHSLLERYSLGLIAFLVAAIAFVALSFIRTNFRPKIVRDSLKHLVFEKVIYDPNRRKN